MGQFGLFAAKKIPPRTHLLDYLGEVHCDDRPSSDYDLSLYRAPDGLVSVGVDASAMGNEGRFVNDYRGIRGKPNAQFEERRVDNGELRMSIWSGGEAIKRGEEILVSMSRSEYTRQSMIDVGFAGELRKIVMESQTTTSVVVVNAGFVNRAGGNGGGRGRIPSGMRRVANKAKYRKDLSCVTSLTLFRYLLCTPPVSSPASFNPSPGVMTGLAAATSISSFITWSTCSGHRSLNGLRTLATYRGADKSYLPNRRLLYRTATVTGPSQTHRVCFLSSCISLPCPTNSTLYSGGTSDSSMLRRPYQRPRTHTKCSV